MKGTFWTVGAFAIGQALRFLQSVILARILTPDIFGLLTIVGSLNTGIQLMSDVGIGKGVVYHKEADDPEFYNTAWTMQAIRSVVLWLVALAIAIPASHFYHFPILMAVIPLTAFSFVLNGFSSISVHLLQKRLQFAKLNVFNTLVSLVGTVSAVGLAILTPTIWAPVLSGLVGSSAYLIGSYFLIGDVRQRFQISKRYALQISQFGRWIFVSSFVFFLSTNYDRLFLASAVPLQLLGVYGIARNISELLSSLFQSLGNGVVFPFIASNSELPRPDFRNQLAKVRGRFLLLAASGLSVFLVTADLAVMLLYDQRYREAAWMLPVLMIGTWFSILANINEATLLGLGKASYTAISNSSKFVVLLAGLPLGIEAYGLMGGVFVVVLSELFRYFPMVYGLKKESFSFFRQDLLLTASAFLLILALNYIRWRLGFGTSFDSLPIFGDHMPSGIN
jgi:O-antigen/teichoic acid export membrane protein